MVRKKRAFIFLETSLVCLSHRYPYKYKDMQYGITVVSKKKSGESHEEREKRASGWLSRERCVAESSAMRETRNDRTYFSR